MNVYLCTTLLKVNVNSVMYFYYPVTVSEQEAADFVNSMEALVTD